MPFGPYGRTSREIHSKSLVQLIKKRAAVAREVVERALDALRRLSERKQVHLSLLQLAQPDLALAFHRLEDLLLDIVQRRVRLRADLLEVEGKVRAFADSLKAEGGELYNPGETIAQCMLALRHVEDSRMRIGKVAQWARDGVSALDRKVP